MDEEDYTSSDGSGGNGDHFVIIPIRIPGNSSSEQSVLDELNVIRSILSGEKVDTSSSGTGEFY